MYRIRFHGRGGQGMKTAGRVLGSALFNEGYEVQDAPRYGAERRGAPLFAFVRADRAPINERGVIRHPDLIVVADDSLVALPAAGVLAGADASSVLLIRSHESAKTWRERLNLSGPVVVLPAARATDDRANMPHVGTVCAGAAARLLGVISRESLLAAVDQVLHALDRPERARNRELAGRAFDAQAAHQGVVQQRAPPSAVDWPPPAWVEPPLESVLRAAPVIRAGATSDRMQTGLWRTMRPILDEARCNRCWWVCSTFCPEGAIAVSDEGRPQIDYDHCKGCLICVAQCPPHAIAAVPEQGAASGSAA